MKNLFLTSTRNIATFSAMIQLLDNRLTLWHQHLGL